MGSEGLRPALHLKALWLSSCSHGFVSQWRGIAPVLRNKGAKLSEAQHGQTGCISAIAMVSFRPSIDKIR